jgi:hypothetical protein
MAGHCPLLVRPSTTSHRQRMGLNEWDSMDGVWRMGLYRWDQDADASWAPQLVRFLKLCFFPCSTELLLIDYLLLDYGRQWMTIMTSTNITHQHPDGERDSGQRVELYRWRSRLTGWNLQMGLETQTCLGPPPGAASGTGTSEQCLAWWIYVLKFWRVLQHCLADLHLLKYRAFCALTHVFLLIYYLTGLSQT